MIPVSSVVHILKKIILQWLPYLSVYQLNHNAILFVFTKTGQNWNSLKAINETATATGKNCVCGLFSLKGVIHGKLQPYYIKVVKNEVQAKTSGIGQRKQEL